MMCDLETATGNCVYVPKEHGPRWMQEEEFLTFIKQFAELANQRNVIRLSYYLTTMKAMCNMPAVDICREKGTMLLSLPSRCFHLHMLLVCMARSNVSSIQLWIRIAKAIQEPK
jgi:hypothetical protein